MGRRKIEIQPITHERNRSVTFLKRKNGLFKKAYELGVLCSVDVAVIIFESKPSAGHHVKLYQYCSTDIHDIVQRHIRYDGEKDTRTPADFSGGASGHKANDMDEDEDDVEDEESQDILPPGRGLNPSSKRARVESSLKHGSGRGGLAPLPDDMGMTVDQIEYRRQLMAIPPPPLATQHTSNSTIPISGERHRQPIRQPTHHQSSNNKKPQLAPVSVSLGGGSRTSPDDSHSSGGGGYGYGSSPMSANAGLPSFRSHSHPQSATYPNTSSFFPINSPPPQGSSFLPPFVDFPHPTSSSRSSTNGNGGNGGNPSPGSRYPQQGGHNQSRSFSSQSPYQQQDQYARHQPNQNPDILSSFLDNTPDSHRSAGGGYGSGLDWPGVSATPSNHSHSRGGSTAGSAGGHQSSEPASASSSVPSAQQDSSNWLDFLSGSNANNPTAGSPSGPGGASIRGIGDLFPLSSNAAGVGVGDEKIKRTRGDSVGGKMEDKDPGLGSPRGGSKESGRPRSSSSRG